MALFTQVDETTFQDLSKRLHKRLKQHHGLTLPLGTFREAFVQAVGYRSLHDARLAWRKNVPSLPAVTAAALGATTGTVAEQGGQAPAVTEGASQAWASSAVSLPLSRRDAWHLALSDGGAPLVAWGQAHPDDLQALPYFPRFTEELLGADGGLEGHRAFQALVEAGLVAVNRAHAWLAFEGGTPMWERLTLGEGRAAADWWLERLTEETLPQAVVALRHRLSLEFTCDYLEGDRSEGSVSPTERVAAIHFLQRAIERPEGTAVIAALPPAALMAMGRRDLALEQVSTGDFHGRPQGLQVFDPMTTARAAVVYGAVPALLAAAPANDAWTWVNHALVAALNEGRDLAAVAEVSAHVRNSAHTFGQTDVDHAQWREAVWKAIRADSAGALGALLDGREAWVRGFFSLSTPQEGRHLLLLLLGNGVPHAVLDRLVPDLDASFTPDERRWRARNLGLVLLLLVDQHFHEDDDRGNPQRRLRKVSSASSRRLLAHAEWLLKKGANAYYVAHHNVHDGDFKDTADTADTTVSTAPRELVPNEDCPAQSAFSLWLECAHYRLDWVTKLVGLGLDLGRDAARAYDHPDPPFVEPLVAGLIQGYVDDSQMAAWQALGAPPLAQSRRRDLLVGSLFFRDGWFQGRRVDVAQGMAQTVAFLDAHGLHDADALAGAWGCVAYPEQISAWHAFTGTLPTLADATCWVTPLKPWRPWRPHGPLGCDGWYARETGKDEEPIHPHPLAGLVSQAMAMGMDVTECTPQGGTLLHWVATLPVPPERFSGHPDLHACAIVRGLLEAGVSPAQKNPDGKTALDCLDEYDRKDRTLSRRLALLEQGVGLEAKGIARGGDPDGG